MDYFTFGSFIKSSELLKKYYGKIERSVEYQEMVRHEIEGFKKHNKITVDLIEYAKSNHYSSASALFKITLDEIAFSEIKEKLKGITDPTMEIVQSYNNFVAMLILP